MTFGNSSEAEVLTLCSYFEVRLGPLCSWNFPLSLLIWTLLLLMHQYLLLISVECIAS